MNPTDFVRITVSTDDAALCTMLREKDAAGCYVNAIRAAYPLARVESENVRCRDGVSVWAEDADGHWLDSTRIADHCRAIIDATWRRLRTEYPAHV